MKAKTKILIRVLVMTIILVGGWLIWSNQNVEAQSGICGPKGMGLKYDVSYCDKSCNVDNDCKFTCGCGAINKNEICHDEGIIYDCVDSDIKCEKDRCVTTGQKLSTQEVVIITDKTEYEQREVMKITVRNSLNDSIWYLDKEIGGWSPWWGLQKLEKSNWEKIEVHKPIDGECQLILREQVPVEQLIKELGTGTERADAWTLENCIEISPIGPKIELKPLTIGTYRLFFKYGLTKDNYAEKTIYSNEFVIK